MSEAGINRSWICSSSYKTSKISRTCVPHMTPVNSTAVLHLTILKSWPCHAQTTRKLQSTAPATKIQPYNSEVVALPRKKVTKYCTCHENPTLRFWSRGPATQKQPESHKVLHLPQKSNLTVTLAEKTQEKMQIIRLETRKK